MQRKKSAYRDDANNAACRSMCCLSRSFLVRFLHPGKAVRILYFDELPNWSSQHKVSLIHVDVVIQSSGTPVGTTAMTKDSSHAFQAI
jgi:hypothetical protein